MTHLTPDELIDAMEGTLDPDRRAHLDACELCQRQVADLSATLCEASDVAVPEPSPLFWTLFSTRVRDAIAAEPEPAAGWSWRWSVALPMGAFAVLIVALVLSIPRPSPERINLGNVENVEPAAADASWALVTDLVGDVDFDTAAGLAIEPGAADRAVMQLTADEQAELTRLLRAELLRAKS